MFKYALLMPVLMVGAGGGYVPAQAAQPDRTTVWSDHARELAGETAAILAELRACIEPGSAPRFNDGIYPFLDKYAAVVAQHSDYPVEAAWPVLKAVVQLDKPVEQELVRLIEERYRGRTRPALIDAILLMNNEVVGDWLHEEAGALIDRKIYYVSAESAHWAGGLGPVMTFHGKGMKELGADIEYIEPWYQLRRDKGNPEGDPLYYEDLGVTDIRGVAEYDVTVSGRQVRVKVVHGINKDGVGTYLVRDVQPDGSSYYTRMLYNYGKSYNPASWEDFTSFFCVASAELIKRLETDRKAQLADRWKPALVHTNDGQTAPLAAIAKGKYENDPVMDRIIYAFTTHTYKNRGVAGRAQGTHVLENMMGITRQYLPAFMRYDIADYTSGGIRLSNWSGAVSRQHRDDVAYIDPTAHSIGVTNGAVPEMMASLFREKLKEKNPAADVERPTVEQVQDTKRRCKELLNDLQVRTANGGVVRVDTDRLLISYCRRLVREKAGRDRAFTDDNIIELVRRGASIVLFGNHQGTNESEWLASGLRELESRIARMKAERPDEFPGMFTFVQAFTAEQKMAILAATDIQVQDSDRTTGAAEFSEEDITANGGLEFSPPYSEGVIMAQGLPLAFERPGSGNTIVPENTSSTAYLEAFSKAIRLYNEDRRGFYRNCAASVRINRIQRYLLTSAAYLREYNRVASRLEAEQAEDRQLAAAIAAEAYGNAALAGQLLDSGRNGVNEFCFYDRSNGDAPAPADSRGLKGFLAKKDAVEKSSGYEALLHHLEAGDYEHYIETLFNGLGCSAAVAAWFARLNNSPGTIIEKDVRMTNLLRAVVRELEYGGSTADVTTRGSWSARPWYAARVAWWLETLVSFGIGACVLLGLSHVPGLQSSVVAPVIAAAAAALTFWLPHFKYRGSDYALRKNILAFTGITFAAGLGVFLLGATPASVVLVGAYAAGHLWLNNRSGKPDNYLDASKKYARSKREDQDGLSAHIIPLSDPQAADVDLTGGKAASLYLLNTISGIKVPPAVAVTTDAYDMFLKANPEIIAMIDRLERLDDEEQIMRLAGEIQRAMRTAIIPENIRKQIIAAYHQMADTRGSGLISVRSSATAEDKEKASFAGQYDTYLYVKDAENAVESVRRVWASMYNIDAVNYRKMNGISHQSTKMAVILQEMVDVAVAGTGFNVDTESGLPMVSINATYGAGEAEVGGLVTSDTWVVDPHKMEIVKRRLGNKFEKITYDVRRGKSVKIGTSEYEQEHFALPSTVVLELVRQINNISQFYHSTQGITFVDTEFAIARNGQIYFTQARPETVWAKGTTRRVAVDIAKSGGLSQIFKRGITGMTGVVTGTLRVITQQGEQGVEEADRRVKPGDIMVVANTTNIWERVLSKAGGAIADIGGPGSHTSVVMREQGKPAIVGAQNAIEILRGYDNQTVTLDATQRIVFLGEVPQDAIYVADNVQPMYGSLDRETEDESWDEANRTGQTHSIDDVGERWIGKPNYVITPFVQEIYLRAHRWAADRLGVKTALKIIDDIHVVNFHDIFGWRINMRKMNLDELEELHRERMENAKNYLAASESLELNPESVDNWIRYFVGLNAFIGIGYIVYRVTEGLFEQELSRKQIVEPYYSQVRPAMGASIGETDATASLRDYKELLDEVRRDDTLREYIGAIPAHSIEEIATRYPALYMKLKRYSYNYKIAKRTEPTISPLEPVWETVRRLNADIAEGRSVDVTNPTPEEFYPDDTQFTRTARLALEAEKARQNSHHQKMRGLWLFREKLQPLVNYLIERGIITSYDDIFNYSPAWLIAQVQEYNQTGLLATSIKSTAIAPSIVEGAWEKLEKNSPRNVMLGLAARRIAAPARLDDFRRVYPHLAGKTFVTMSLALEPNDIAEALALARTGAVNAVLVARAMPAIPVQQDDRSIVMMDYDAAREYALRRGAAVEMFNLPVRTDAGTDVLMRVLALRYTADGHAAVALFVEPLAGFESFPALAARPAELGEAETALLRRAFLATVARVQEDVQREQPKLFGLGLPVRQIEPVVMEMKGMAALLAPALADDEYRDRFRGITTAFIPDGEYRALQPDRLEPAFDVHRADDAAAGDKEAGISEPKLWAAGTSDRALQAKLNVYEPSVIIKNAESVAGARSAIISRVTNIAKLLPSPYDPAYPIGTVTCLSARARDLRNAGVGGMLISPFDKDNPVAVDINIIDESAAIAAYPGLDAVRPRAPISRYVDLEAIAPQVRAFWQHCLSAASQDRDLLRRLDRFAADNPRLAAYARTVQLPGLSPEAFLLAQMYGYEQLDVFLSFAAHRDIGEKVYASFSCSDDSDPALVRAAVGAWMRRRTGGRPALAGVVLDLTGLREIPSWLPALAGEVRAANPDAAIFAAASRAFDRGGFTEMCAAAGITVIDRRVADGGESSPYYLDGDNVSVEIIPQGDLLTARNGAELGRLVENLRKTCARASSIIVPDDLLADAAASDNPGRRYLLPSEKTANASSVRAILDALGIDRPQTPEERGRATAYGLEDTYIPALEDLPAGAFQTLLAVDAAGQADYIDAAAGALAAIPALSRRQWAPGWRKLEKLQRWSRAAELGKREDCARELAGFMRGTWERILVKHFMRDERAFINTADAAAFTGLLVRAGRIAEERGYRLGDIATIDDLTRVLLPSEVPGRAAGIPAGLAGLKAELLQDPAGLTQRSELLVRYAELLAESGEIAPDNRQLLNRCIERLRQDTAAEPLPPMAVAGMIRLFDVAADRKERVPTIDELREALRSANITAIKALNSAG
jgi:phosphohistidine swiveling domain-containing protein/glycogen synthase